MSKMNENPQGADVALVELAKSRVMREACFELVRRWRMGWDAPGSPGYQSYMMVHRRMTDLLPDYRGSFVQLARTVLALPAGDDSCQ